MASCTGSTIKPVTGETFAETSAVVRRCRDVTHRVAELNENGWRLNTAQEFFWRLVIPVRIDAMAVSDVDLAKAMLLGARAIIDERLASLEPKDGVERAIPALAYPYTQCKDPCYPHDGVPAGVPFSVRPKDLRSKEGRAWRKAQREAVGA